MRRAALLGIAMLATVVAGQAPELNLVLGKEALSYVVYRYRTGYPYYHEKQLIQPFGAGLDFSLPLGEHVRFGIGARFVWRTVSCTEYNLYYRDDTIKVTTSLSGLQGQTTILAGVPVFSLLSIHGGLGLSYQSYWLNDDYRCAHDTAFFERRTETTIKGPVQTFIAGVRFQVSDKIGFSLKAERVGISLLREDYRMYNSDDELVTSGERSYLTNEFADVNKTGFILELNIGI